MVTGLVDPTIKGRVYWVRRQIGGAIILPVGVLSDSCLWQGFSKSDLGADGATSLTWLILYAEGLRNEGDCHRSNSIERKTSNLVGDRNASNWSA